MPKLLTSLISKLSF